MEDKTKTFLKLVSQKRTVANIAAKSRVGIKPTTQALKKLAEQGFITARQGAVYTLTEKGEKKLWDTAQSADAS